MHRAARLTRQTGRPSAAPDQTRFGEAFRQKRLPEGCGLRRFVQLVGISPMYVSVVERGRVDPLTAKGVERTAQLLGEPAGVPIAIAARKLDDLPAMPEARRLNAHSRRAEA